MGAPIDLTGYTPPGDVPSLVSAAFVAFLDVGYLIAIGVACAKARSHGGRARAMRAADARAGQPLVPGYVAVTGEVALIDGAGSGPGVRVAQSERRIRRKGGDEVTWTETSRRVDAHPFDLITAGGERVRVEPGEGMLLVAPLEVERDARGGRERVARLAGGEAVTALGELSEARGGGGYRGGGRRWQLVPRRGERMIVSTEPLASRHASRARLHLGWSVAMIVALVATLAWATGDYHLLAALGKRDTAAVRAVARAPREVRNSKYRGVVVDDYELSYEVPELGLRERVPTAPWVGAAVQREMSRAKSTGEPVTLPIVVAAGRHKLSWDRLPTVSSSRTYVCIVAFVVLALAYALHAWLKRPWYERRRIDESSHPVTTLDD